VVGVVSDGSGTARSSITIGRPAGTVAGHVLVASVVSNDDDPAFGAPAGWALVRQDTVVDALRQAIYVKVATLNEPAAYTWTVSSARRLAGGITTYAGVNPVTPVDAHGAQTNTVSSTVTAPSITTTVPGALLVHFAALNAEGTLASPLGMTERWEAAAPRASSTRDATASSSDTTQTAQGPTGPRTATATQPGRSIGAHLALRPA
jgi:hypothetical protein